MSVENQQAQPLSLIRRSLRFLAFRVLPALLVIAIIWSMAQVLSVFITQFSAYNQIIARQDSYIGTATAIAPDSFSEKSQGSSANGNVRLVQFATNTPMPDKNATNDTGSAFPTNTPAASAPQPVTATRQESSVESNVLSTPIPLPTFFAPQAAELVEIAGTAVPPRAAVIPRAHELVNIVLLGGDDEITNDNTIRTDTIIIVSINTETNSVAMLSLPRDLFVYVPTPTMTRINTVFGIGEALAWSGGGFGLLRETIFYNFGIQVHYFARIDISGLEQIIDTLGGVDLAVDCTYQDFALVGVDVPEDAILVDEEALLWQLPVGYYHMSGGEALWYARTRSQGLADDFDRGRRQQQLLRAIFRTARDNGQLVQLPELWNQLNEVVETDVPFSVVLGLLPIALDLEFSRIESFNLIRTFHTTPWQPTGGNFAGQAVQLPNMEPLQQLFTDFYTPPTESQLEVAGPSVAIFNGTTNPDWDLVASERLRSIGLNAFAAGHADQNDYTESVLIDHVADDKGSPVPSILDALNLSSSNVTINPDPNRSVDYELIIGSNFNSCAGTVLEPES